ncbi:MAG: hypothetical protein ACP6KW_06550 [Candidatus Thorarchaeota archaeon]
MTRSSVRNTAAIVTGAFLTLFMVVFLLREEESQDLIALLTVLGPVVSLALGMLGMSLFGKDSIGRGDGFMSFGLWLSLGLVVLTLAEIAGVVLGLAGGQDYTFFTIGLMQMPGFMLWGIGIIGYLKSVNQSIDMVHSERLWPILVSVMVMGSLALVAIAMSLFPDQSILMILVGAPTFLWFLIASILVGGLLWVFREGFLARPMAILLIGVMICLIRGVFWLTTDHSQFDVIDDFLAIESYFAVGAALSEAARLRIVDS